MAKDVSFSLDPRGGRDILQRMMLSTVKRKGEAIAARARGIAGGMSSDAPVINVTAKVGVIKRGARAIATVSADGKDAHQNYVGHVALAKAKDAGRR